MFRTHQFLQTGLLALCSTGVSANDPGEVTSALGNVAPAIVIFAIAATLLLSLFYRSTAGNVARIITAKTGTRRIRKVLTARSKDVLDDFIMPGAYGGLTCIDHAILTSGGIICIQTKHCNGIVFGEAKEPQWTNVDGVHRRKFLNPLIQNEGRASALQKIIPDVPVANLVVFTGDVQFTSPLEKNVIHVRNLDSYIAKFVFGPCKISDWDALWLTVKSAVLKDAASRKDFNAQLSFS